MTPPDYLHKTPRQVSGDFLWRELHHAVEMSQGAFTFEARAAR